MVKTIGKIILALYTLDPPRLPHTQPIARKKPFKDACLTSPQFSCEKHQVIGNGNFKRPEMSAEGPTIEFGDAQFVQSDSPIVTAKLNNSNCINDHKHLMMNSCPQAAVNAENLSERGVNR